VELKRKRKKAAEYANSWGKRNRGEVAPSQQSSASEEEKNEGRQMRKLLRIED
jgi:hypothetical protein